MDYPSSNTLPRREIDYLYDLWRQTEKVFMDYLGVNIAYPFPCESKRGYPPGEILYVMINKTITHL